MRTFLSKTAAFSAAAVLAFAGTALSAADGVAPGVPADVVKKAKVAIQRGVNYLIDNQESDGSWMHHPAVTALCVMALHGSGTGKNAELCAAAVKKGKAFFLKFVQKDGSIWMAGEEHEYPNYTTSIALSALAVLGDKKDEQVMRAARKYLLGSQLTDKENPALGGIGYGKSGPGHPDLSNTQWALEALHLTDYLDREPNAKTPEDTKKADLAWKNAAKFLSKLQHLPESNDAVWVVKDKNDPNRGSFIYQFGVSRAGYEADGKTLRGYGSMTYAGLKSMIYAKLKKDDPRVKAAVEWGAKHYTLKENPGIGPHGWFYYIQTFAKAHAAYGGDIIVTPDGKKHNWRVDLLNELISLQQKDGTWVNKKSGRWWEAIPQLITAYSMISMEVALGDDLKK
jgi:squalene-hopene/tetraprenyl-beta-curcumene cyclase